MEAAEHTSFIPEPLYLLQEVFFEHVMWVIYKERIAIFHVFIHARWPAPPLLIHSGIIREE